MIECLTGAAAVARSAEIARILAASFESAALRWPAESVAATLSAPGAVALIAAEGCALIRVVADEAELLTIAVGPGARRQGLGARLLAACSAEAGRRGALRLHLEVAAGNEPAIALYDAAGFVTTGRRPRYFAGPEGRDDALLMSRGTAGAAP